MFIVNFFRWLFGYAEFCLKSNFPERYLNIAFKNGLHLWKTKGEKESLKGCVKIKELNEAMRLAQKAGMEFEITREHGLPYLCRRYRKRAGLLAGLIFGAALSCILSRFIWNIEIHAPDGINEYEIRNELKQLGFSEGFYYTFDSIVDLRHKLLIMDNRISWMSINIFGTNAVVELSDRDYPIESDKTDSNRIGNIISDVDGTITGISVSKGSAAVKIGEGIRKGQLLVSGIIEYNDGTAGFSDSSAHIKAKTSEAVVFRLPMNSKCIIKSDNAITKRSLSFFNINIPLTLCGDPMGSFFREITKKQAELFGQGLPIFIKEEQWEEIGEKDIDKTEEKLKNILNKRQLMYEYFLTLEDNRKIIKRKKSFSKSNGTYELKVLYELEEEIGKKQYVMTGDSG